MMQRRNRGNLVFVGKTENVKQGAKSSVSSGYQECPMGYSYRVLEVVNLVTLTQGCPRQWNCPDNG